MTEIQKRLFQMQDLPYRDFQSRLIPTVDPETVIGIRTPALRAYAKELAKQPETEAFLRTLPHRYFDENQLHAFLLSELRDYETCLRAVDAFLPCVDNWATCDQMSPRVFGRHKAELLGEIRRWLEASHPYTVRFALRMLMQHYLDADFAPAYPELAARLTSEEYYVRMMVAWYFATALAKQYEAVLPYLTEQRLDPWTHNKAIQKAIESDRVSPAHKQVLRQLRQRQEAPSAPAQN